MDDDYRVETDGDYDECWLKHLKASRQQRSEDVRAERSCLQIKIVLKGTKPVFVVGGCEFESLCGAEAYRESRILARYDPDPYSHDE